MAAVGTKRTFTVMNDDIVLPSEPYVNSQDISHASGSSSADVEVLSRNRTPDRNGSYT